MSEIGDIVKGKSYEEQINDDDVKMFVYKRDLKLHCNEVLESYMRKRKKSIGDISKKDLQNLTKGYNNLARDIMIQQIIYYLESNWGKPLSRVKENKKSVLFNELENNGKANRKGNIKTERVIRVGRAKDYGKDLKGND